MLVAATSAQQTAEAGIGIPLFFTRSGRMME
jgi:hypothetical protein